MDLTLFFIFLILFLLSAFFSASEIALMSLPSHKIDSIVKQKKFASSDLKFIKDRNDRLLITILIWNNLVNVYIAALATQLAIVFASQFMYEEALVIWITTWIVTFLLLMFWEIVPKSFATKNRELISLLVAKPYRFLLIIFSPILFFIEIIIRLVTGKKTVSRVTEEEIESFIDMWKNHWALEEWEHEKIKNMLEFSDITVEEIFTPRVKIDAIDIETSVDDAVDYVLNTTHTRIPVYSWNIDNIDFVINLRFLLNEQKKWNWSKKLKDLKLDKVIKIPLNSPIDRVLEIFRNSHKHLAIVMDEYGGVAWLVTLEDIIEEVFWDIKDEFDKEKDEIKKIGDDKYEVSPTILFEDLLEELDLTFDMLCLDEKDYYATTLNYFITEELERFPNSWEVIEKEINDKEWNQKRILKFKINNVIDWHIDSIEVSIIKKKLDS